MAILKRRLMREKKSPEASPPAGEVPPFIQTTEVSGQTTENKNEAGLASSLASPPSAAANRTKDGSSVIRLLPAVFTHLSITQKILLAVVSVSAALLTYSLVSSLRASKPNKLAETKIEASVETDFEKAAPDGKNSLQSNTSYTPERTEIKNRQSLFAGTETDSQGEPMSLKLAEDYFAAKDYVSAYNAYEGLYKNLKGENYELIKDFLQLRLAQCLEKKGYEDKAGQILKKAAQSRSAALRVIANYYAALIDMKAGQYLKARTRAYRAIALTATLSSDCEWALALERDCTFLAAEAVTRQVLSLSDADKDLPNGLLAGRDQKNLLTGLDESELQKILNAGAEKLNSGLLAPVIRPVDSPHTARGEISYGSVGGISRWMIICSGPSIEELMSRFAANAGLDVKWERPEDGKQTTDNGNGWNFSVSLYMPSATAQQAVSTSAGAAGLMAQIDDNGVITITNPEHYTDLSSHSRMLCENAMWLWRTLLLTYSDDPRIPDEHFALGVLQEIRDRAGEAITEYKLIANRFPQTALAPYALLRSSRLKTELRDFSGASRDLKQLIEQYPDNELIGQAYLDLAENTMKSGLYDDACSLYRKAYSIGLARELQTQAAFGAGYCYYQTSEYDSAVKWLSLYISQLDRDSALGLRPSRDQGRTTNDEYKAHLLLGKANLATGKLEAACNALNRTVQNATSAEDYIEAVASLIDAQIKQENFVAALGVVENVRAWPFSQEQSTRLLLLKSRILRSMGLSDQAVTILTDKTPYLTDSRLRADIMLELADCYIASENYDLARSHLVEALSAIEAGQTARQAQLTLADVCLKLNEFEQTISICTKLLETSADEQIKQQASKILASAYSRQKEYDKAALALLSENKK